MLLLVQSPQVLVRWYDGLLASSEASDLDAELDENDNKLYHEVFDIETSANKAFLHK